MTKIFCYLLTVIILLGCNSAKDSALQDDLGVVPPPSDTGATGTDLSSAKIVKIVEAGSGAQSEILDLELDLSIPVSFKAALFDLRGNYLEDIEVAWSFSNSNFSDTDNTVHTGTTGVTFTPSSAGFVSLRAIYTTEDPSVINNTDFTGLLTITDPSDVGILNSLKTLKITQAGSGTQTEILDESLDVADVFNLKASLYDLQGNFIEDVSVDWTFSNTSFGAGDLVKNSGVTGATFTPSNSGMVTIRAVYNTTDKTIINNTDLTGLINVAVTTTPSSSNNFRILKIIAAGAGDQAITNDETLNIGDNLSIKAALFDTVGNYVEDVAVTWSFSNNNFGIGDRTVNAGTTGITFTPDNAGVAMINATYTTSNSDVILSTDFTGLITVVDPNAAPSSADFRVLKIIAAGVGAQTEANDSTMNIAESLNLKAALYDTVGNYVSDVAVTWSFSNNNFGVGDRTINAGTTGVTFTPDNSGATSIKATYVSTDPNIILSADFTGTITVNDPNAPINSAEFRVLKIIAAGVGAQAESNDSSMNIADSLNLKAALYDTVGNYISDVAVTWSFSNNNFGVGDRTINAGTTGVTFTPDNAGSAMINATYTTTNTNVILNADFTGLITVVDPNAAPSSADFRVLKIIAAGVGAQTEANDSTMNIADSLNLKAALYDTVGNYVSDVAVTWSFSNNNFGVGDRTVNAGTTGVTFTPDNMGLVMIKATYSTTNPNIISNADFTGTITVNDPAAPSSLAALRVFKIVAAGAGSQAAVDDVAALVSNPTVMKAALFDLSGNYISDAPAIWTFSNTTFPLADLVSSNAGVNGTFTPSRPGTVVVNALYTGGNTSVISPYDSTGLFTITNIQTPDSVLLTSGNGQSGTVNNNLATQLKMQVLDSFSQPIPGITVTWSVTQGSGSIIGTNPVTTDVNGYAYATVKLGTQAGGGNNQYRAVVSGYPALLVDFSATATAGPQDHLTFTTQPAILFASTSFGVQPVVELRDLYDNLVSASGTITMSKQAGTGTLGGTLTATMTSGVATFSNLNFNTAGSGVVLRASNGTVTGDSASLTISAPPPGACTLNDAAFLTSDGGCKVLASGLVWSVISTSTMTWYAAIWDNVLAGSAAMDADDAGRGNDYSESAAEDCNLGGYLSCDNATNTFQSASPNVVTYCKSLNEGGKTDWRVPTRTELNALYSAGSPTHISGTLNQWFWASSGYPGQPYSYVVNLSSGANSYDSRIVAYRVICVRGGTRNLPTQLSVLSGPTSVGLNQAPHSTTPLYITIKDASGTRVNAGGRTVTISATSLGTLGGTLTATTDHTGLATFTGFTLNTAGSATITISSSGLTDTTRTISVATGSLGIPCLLDDGFFQSADGGCKVLASGLVWSTISTSTMTWYAAVWDNVMAGSAATDADDAGRGNDYSESAAEDCNLGGYLSCDNATNTYQSASPNIAAYCKNLNEGGKTDWRIPTRTELNALYSAGAPTHVTGSLNQWFWASSGYPGNPYSYLVNLSSGANSYDSRVNPYRVICVRGGTRNLPTQLSVLSGPTSVGLNQVPHSTTPLYVTIKDASGTRVNAGGRTVTISATNLGTLGGTLTATTDHTGLATFTGFTLNTAGSATITISSSGLTDTTRTINVAAGSLGIPCLIEDGFFQSADGGCKEMASGLVWSTISTSTMTWYAAVWDSLLAGSTAIDADDASRGNDYSESAAEDCNLGGYLSCDNSTNTYQSGSINIVSYCKNLNEGGKTDWRLPTRTEINSAYSAGAPSHLTGSLNQYFWVSSGYPGNPYSYMVNLSTGVNSYDSRVNPYRVICVRGGTRNSPTKLTVTSGTAINGASITGATITVRVQDASSNNVNASGRSVTISGTNLGTLGGTVTGTTDHTGKVTFSAFTLDTAGFATLTISSAGLTSATHNIEIRAGILAGQHVCRAESSRFITQYGGCHDTTEHLVWSAMSSGTYNWYQTVWDSTLASNNAPDGDDGVRTNDYDLSYGPLGYTDTSLVDYCHDLNQGGYTDWKPATVTQVTNAGTAAAAGTYFDSSLIGVNFWTGGTYQAGGSWPSWGWYGSFSSSTYSSTVVDKNTAYKVVCVRAQN